MRIGIPLFLTLSVSASLQAEQVSTPQGYYHYPQPPFYVPQAPPGYVPPAYPGAVQPVTPASPARSSVSTSDARVESALSSGSEGSPAPDQERYPWLSADAIVAVAEDFRAERGRLGPVLADREGRTLYVQKDVSAPDCDADCRRLWLPLPADASIEPPAPFGIARHPDGSSQWTWDGRPLYRWIGDAGAGDVSGDGVDGRWYAVRFHRGRDD